MLGSLTWRILHDMMDRKEAVMSDGSINRALSIISMTAMARAAGADPARAEVIADQVLAEFFAHKADVETAHRVCERIEELVRES